MPKTGDKCMNSGYYKFSGHVKCTTKCHPSFDEDKISMRMFETFPTIHTCDKDAFWTYVKPT